MKKILFTLFTIISAITTHAQKARLQAIEVVAIPNNEKGIFLPADFFAVLNLDDQTFHCYSKNEADYKLLKIVKDWKDNNGLSHVKYKAIDHQNEECTVEFVAQGKLINVAVQYPLFMLVYKMKFTD